VAVQADGKILAAGSTGPVGKEHFALARYQSDGTLDRTFGANGRVRTALAPRNDLALQFALEPDGKIVAVGAGGGDSHGRSGARRVCKGFR
jgi:Domain of unknown function (DUF5122) beta-propeller